MPGKPDVALASMGIYIFDAQYLYDELERDMADPDRATTSARTSFRARCAKAARWPTRSA